MKRLAWALALLLAGPLAQADSLTGCQVEPQPSAAEQDRLLRLAAVIKTELQASGQALALISRAGLNLRLIGQRYSHAGLSLRQNSHSPWAVRQLYYACDEQAPRIFDQGLSGFVLGSGRHSFVSVLLLPDEAAEALTQSALDDRQALQLLGAHYSANAYAFGLRYQNCNQWLVELLAAAWSGTSADTVIERAEAQAWLREAGYQPSSIELGLRPLYWLSGLLPWLHQDDHPAEDRAAARYRLSLPAGIEAFIQRRLPETRRIEFCADDQHIVVHAGWTPLGADCQAGPDDRRIALQG
ncbi:DUF2145 domain-containing protein [Paucibacter sp. APW11]|uniref:DUF2145 domain-containing protein n=1 Tax=Roseateles aquae TaxID=3077235 RepID=A0ABU3PGC4_9BURK|nr:DUF2145 domain-containing protein [Paucibacter sp. APW11]MDT9001583.1 DUF2145 domain-containing protein [Paucibacter sp. APW11]